MQFWVGEPVKISLGRRHLGRGHKGSWGIVSQAKAAAEGGLSWSALDTQEEQRGRVAERGFMAFLWVRKSVTGKFGAEHVMCVEFSQVHFDHCVEVRMKGTGVTAGGQSCDYPELWNGIYWYF